MQEIKQEKWFEVTFYKNEWTVCQSLMFIHCGIQQYCDESKS